MTMRKPASVLCAGALAVAALVQPIAADAVRADDGASMRLYLSIPFGSEKAIPERTRFGFQLDRTWEEADGIGFEHTRSLPLLNFATTRDGLDRADVLGFDAILIHEAWTGEQPMNFGFDPLNPGHPSFWFLAIGGGALTACLAEWFGWCEDDDGNGGGSQPEPE